MSTSCATLAIAQAGLSSTTSASMSTGDPSLGQHVAEHQEATLETQGGVEEDFDMKKPITTISLQGNFRKPQSFVWSFSASSASEFDAAFMERFGRVLLPGFRNEPKVSKSGISTRAYRCTGHSPDLEGVTEDGECPWVARLRITPDGSHHLYAPDYQDQVFEGYAAIQGAVVSEGGNRIDVPTGECGAFFITKCGHIHLLDAPDKGRFTPFLESRVKQALDLYSDNQTVIEVLRADPDLKNFTSRIDACVAKLRKPAVEKKPAMNLQLMQEAILSKCRDVLTCGTHVYMNPEGGVSSGQYDDALIYLSDWDSGELYFLVFSARSLDAAMESGTIYLDSTFNLIKQGPDSKRKLLAASLQDARRRLFMCAVMAAPEENPHTYSVFLRLLFKAMRIVRPASDTRPINLEKFMFDGMPGLQRLISELGVEMNLEVWRGMCLYHAKMAALRQVNAKAGPSERDVFSFIFETLADCPSLAALLAVWKYLSQKLLASETPTELIQYIDQYYLNPGKELFFWTPAAGKRRQTAHGAAANCTNNPAESGFSKLKRDHMQSKKTPGSVAELLSLQGQSLVRQNFKEFAFTHDYVKDDANMRHSAIVESWRIEQAMSTAGHSMPPRASISLAKETQTSF